jgi:hypothetical protein
MTGEGMRSTHCEEEATRRYDRTVNKNNKKAEELWGFCFYFPYIK